MTAKIMLRLRGIDLRDLSNHELIPPALEDLSFESHGPVSIAVVYSDDPDPASAAYDWARLIGEHLPGVTVTEVFDELVSTSDIAARCGVAPEAVRLWAAGRRRAALRPFPTARQVVGTGSGGKTSTLYAWREVLYWVREVLGSDPDEAITYLDDQMIAYLNAEIADLGRPRGTKSTGWTPFGSVLQVINVTPTESRWTTPLYVPDGWIASGMDSQPAHIDMQVEEGLIPLESSATGLVG